MTLHIPLTPADEAKLRERAAATGEALEEVAAQLMRSALRQSNGAQPPSKSLTPEETSRQREALRSWAELGRATGHPVDDSRESICEGRA